MANTRAIRRRIKSVKNTAQITKAMQMVAASKMRKAQQAALAGRPYAKQLNKILLSVSQAVEELASPFFAKRENRNPGVVLITTDKGLCGPLNTNLLREVIKFPENTKFVNIGKKGRQFLTRLGRNIVADFEIRENPEPIHVRAASQFMIDMFLKGEIDSIQVLYPHFVNTLTQQTELAKLLPISDVSEMKAGKNILNNGLKSEDIPNEYLFEPSASFVLEKLVPYYLHFEVYQKVLDARASEHSARMVAMKSATDNAKSLVKDLTLQYNKARQADITNQILEISTAQMAMN